MSNPVTDAQPEDVLSSIRRLVSSDVQPDGEDAEDVEQTSTEAHNPGVDRLVLSPALRVAAAEDEVSDAADSAAEFAPDNAETETQVGDDDQPFVDEGTEPDSKSSEDRAAVMAIEDEETEPELGSLSSEIDPETLQFLFRARKRPTDVDEPVEDETTAVEDGETDAADASEIGVVDTVEKQPPLLLTNPEPRVEEGDERAGDGEQDPQIAGDESAHFVASNQTDDPVSPDVLAAKVADVEAVIAETSEQWKSGDMAVDEDVDAAAESLEWEDHLDNDGSDEDLSQAEQATASTEGYIEIEAEPVENAEESQETLTSEDVESDLARDDPAHDDQAELVGLEEPLEEELPPREAKPAWSADVRADKAPIDEFKDEGFEASLEAEVAELEELVEDDTTGEATVDLQSDDKDVGPSPSHMAEDAVLDEEALRELIGDIVHQELNGKLGERITHNVRKLVRRELQRALASQDLS